SNKEVRNKPTLPPTPADNTVALQMRLSRLESETEQLRAQLAEMLNDLERSRADATESAPGDAAASRRSGGGASWAIEALLKARLTAVLVGVGLPGGAAALVAWFIARRLRRRVQAVVIHDEARPLPQIVE